MNIESIFEKLNAIPADKVAHFASGVVLYALTMPGLGLWYAMALVSVTAVTKELYDYMHRDIHTPDVWDAVATMAGGAVGLFIGVTA
jgi:hypothetical protein